MNNIEILEDYIEALRKPKPFKYTNEQKAQAIENLIQENKELKERCLKLESDRFWDNVIPKSKVKEKIEEYSKMINATYSDITSSGDYRRNVCFEIRKVLQELLEEGE